MTAHSETVPSLVDRIKQTLVGLKMPRAIEILDVTVRRIERGELTAIEAIDALLAEELTLRENRRIKIALMMARLSTIKRLAGFDFSLQPSLDRNRIMARSPRWSSSTAARSCTSLDHPAPGKAICPWRLAFRPSEPAAASTSPR
jgi:IstB-like ATP binding protein